MKYIVVDDRAGKILERNPKRSFSRRSVEELVGIAFHHTAGGSNVLKAARYHARPNSRNPRGNPGLAYSIFITDGLDAYAGENDPSSPQVEVWLAWDLDRATWSHGGGRRHPDLDGDGDVDRDDGEGRANHAIMSICMGGNFNGPGNDAREPQIAQMVAAISTVGYLLGLEDFSEEPFPRDLFGALSHLDPSRVICHADMGKSQCPGYSIEEMTKWLRRLGGDGGPGNPKKSDKDWQKELASNGYYSGGIDGIWGPQSREALREFQIAIDLEPTGMKNKPTELILFSADKSIREWQSALRVEGYYDSRVDGIWGPISQEALEQYQETKGFRVGLRDEATEKFLFKGK